MRLILLAASAMFLAAACGESGETAAPAAPAPAAAPAAAPAGPSAAELERAALEAERARLEAGLTAPFADEAAWTTACKDAGVDPAICDCAVKKTVETIGAKGLYSWVWEGYVRREGAAQMRSGKFFTDNGISTEDRQKFADAVATCYQ